MALSITSNFYPYRLSLKRKEPVELKVEVMNKGEKDAMVSLQLMLDRNLALDKAGLKSAMIEKIDSLKPNEKKTFVYSVHAKGFTGPGIYPVAVKASEHYQSYRYAEREYTKSFELVIGD